MEVTGQDDAPAVLPQESFPGVHRVEVRVSMDDLEKRKKIAPVRIRNNGWSSLSPRCEVLYWLRYRGFI
jgi:hypothetical protein